MSNRKRVAKAIVFSAIASAISYFINFFLASYITKHAGIEAYGFVTVSRTFINYASIITTAFTVFIVRYISVNYHQNKMKEANAYFASSIKACIVISSIIFAASLIIVFFLERLLVIPERLVNSVKILFVVMFAGFCFTTITTPFQSAAYIKNRLDLSGIARISSYVIEAVVLVVLFYCFDANIYFVGVGSLSAATMIFVFNFVLSKKLTPELTYDSALVSANKIKNLVKNGIWSSVNQLGNVLNSGLDLLIANMFLTGVEMGQIAVAKTIGSIFSTVISVIYQPLHPQMLKNFSSGNTDVFMKDLTKSMKICGFFGALLYSGFFSLGLLYFKLWLPGEDSLLLHRLTLLTVLNYVTESVVMPLYYVSTLTVKNKVPCWVTIGGGVLNVLAMYVLLNYTNIGVYAVVITTAVIMISINLIFNPLYAAWCLKSNSKPVYIVIFRHILACGCMILAFIGIEYLIMPNNWAFLILSAILMAVIGVLIYIPIVCNKSELLYFKNLLKRKMLRRN